MKSWYIYMLKCRDNTIYTGITTDIPHRLDVHNQGKGAKYTRARLPVKLVWQKKVIGESEARKLEYTIKQLSRKKKLQLIQKKTLNKPLK